MVHEFVCLKIIERDEILADFKLGYCVVVAALEK